MWKVLRLPMHFFSQRLSGDIQQRKVFNTEIAGQFADVLGPLLINTFMMLFYLIVMIRYSPLLSLIGVVSILINKERKQ